MANSNAGSIELRPLSSVETPPNSRPVSPQLELGHDLSEPLIPASEKEDYGRSGGFSKDEHLATVSNESGLESATTTVQTRPNLWTRTVELYDFISEFAFPCTAVAYLAFCYAAYAKTIPLKSSLFDASPSNIGE